MTTTNNLPIIIAALLLSASSGFAPPSPVSSSSRSHELLQSSSCPNIRTITSSSSRYNDEYSFARLSTIQRMASEDEEAEKTTESDAAANDDNSSSKATAAGGGTIALTSAKSAADAAVSSTATANTKNSSPSNTGFSLLLLPTLLIKFTIVLIVKFATDVVVYPTLYLWRWARLGRKKIGRGLARLLGREVEEKVNGARTVVNGDSVGDFQ
eukprot:scaffold33495_cov105-Skeletonema_dohrnii-CCMP3373.AAC.2